MFVAKSIGVDHKDLIQDVAYDFHGKRMATCSCDQLVKVGTDHACCFDGKADVIVKYWVWVKLSHSMQLNIQFPRYWR